MNSQTMLMAAHFDGGSFLVSNTPVTAQKIKSSIKDFFSKFDQIRSFLPIWSYLLKKSSMENFIFCVVSETHVNMSFYL